MFLLQTGNITSFEQKFRLKHNINVILLLKTFCLAERVQIGYSFVDFKALDKKL